MVRSVQESSATVDLPPAAPDEELRLWGLTADELHRAYWRARGVQVIERGSGEKSDAAAELYLLVEPAQWVIFSLREIIEKMTWNGAEAVYIRVVQEEERRYRERVVLDAAGHVECIERFYRPHPHSSYRVVLTRSRRLAEAWQRAPDRRTGWREVQHLLPFYQIDHGRCAGSCFDAASRDEQSRLLDTLASVWKDPHRAIEGIEEIAPDVWGPALLRGKDLQVVVGPAWVGDGAVTADDVLVGPCWRGDRAGISSNGHGARLRPIAEIEPPREMDDGESALAPRRDGFFTIKRGFDIAVSAAVLLVTLPVFLVIAIAIVIDDGRPIFFGHARQTRGGGVFKCWKFRTMRRDADAIKARLLEMNVCDGPQFFIENDPRVTRVGRILRKFHLDEIPQFFNVLVGQMSIVGPRPSPDDENQYCPAWRELRLSVRPGITGLWQIERTRAPGRDFQEWIRYDIEYVRRAGFWFDLKICARTIWNIVGRRHHRAPYEAG